MITTRSSFFFPFAAVAVFCIHVGYSHAQVTFDWVTVGNPGNAADTTGFGSVGYSFRISKHEVTNNQYTDFLNAVAVTVDNGLYNASMSSDAVGGIMRSGTSGSYSYAVKPGQGDNPVAFVSFFDAMRFTNWLENGQPTGLPGPGTTEDGVYAIGSGLNETRAANASYFIPSDDEWYKSAYHKNDGVTGNYWEYPTSSDAVPVSEPPAGGSNSGNFRDANFSYAVTGSGSFDNNQNYLTDVGAYSSALSPYGTFDQAGNVREWTEGIDSSSFRVIRGGAWGTTTGSLPASFREASVVSFDSNNTGFRVASRIPEPNSGLFGILAAVGLLMRRKIR